VANSATAANVAIRQKKEETGAANLQAVERELALRRAIKTRHQEPMAGGYGENSGLKEEKAGVDREKEEARQRLNDYTTNVIRPYQDRINHYLEAFNAGFRIAETRHGYPGGTAASSYQLMINNIAVDLGDGQTPVDQPSFKNTLSSG